MKLFCRWRCAALAASVAAVALSGSFAAEKTFAADIVPGFNPDTGQINPGVGEPVPTGPHPQIKIPTPEEARAALMKIHGAAQGNPATNGSSANSTTGAAASESASAQSGPPGSTPQTVPAKLSSENDTLDRVPTMAFPLPLSDAQRQRVYQAVMGDKQAAASDAATLAPASALSPHQALNEMHPMPQSIADIAAVKDLKYLKTKDKVFLVEPATRTVVAEITK